MFWIKVSKNIYLKQVKLFDALDIFAAIDRQRDYLGRWLPFVSQTICINDTAVAVKAMMDKVPDAYVFTIREVAHRFDHGKFIGLIGLKDIDYRTGTAEIGYWLLEEYQGAGIITRSVDALCRFGCEKLDLKHVVIKCATANRPSNKIPKQLGFSKDHVVKNGEKLSDGEYVNLNVYLKDIEPRLKIRIMRLFTRYRPIKR